MLIPFCIMFTCVCVNHIFPEHKTSAFGKFVKCKCAGKHVQVCKAIHFYDWLYVSSAAPWAQEIAGNFTLEDICICKHLCACTLKAKFKKKVNFCCNIYFKFGILVCHSFFPSHYDCQQHSVYFL